MTEPVSGYAEWIAALESAQKDYQAEQEAKKAAEAEERRKQDALQGAELREALLTVGFDTGELLTGIYTAPDGVQIRLHQYERSLVIEPTPIDQTTNYVALVLHHDYSAARRAVALMEAISDSRIEIERRKERRKSVQK